MTKQEGTATAQLDLALSRTLLVANLVKTMTQVGARNSPRLWIVTRGAQQLDPGDRVTLAQTQLRGFARVLTFEHPELKTTLVDVEGDGTGSATALIEANCCAASEGPQLRSTIAIEANLHGVESSRRWQTLSSLLSSPPPDTTAHPGCWYN